MPSSGFCRNRRDTPLKMQKSGKIIPAAGVGNKIKFKLFMKNFCRFCRFSFVYQLCILSFSEIDFTAKF